MTTDPNDPQPSLFVNRPREPDAIQSFAIRVGTVVRAGLLILFWLVVAASALAAAFVCLRGLIWAVLLIQRALGIP